MKIRNNICGICHKHRPLRFVDRDAFCANCLPPWVIVMDDIFTTMIADVDLVQESQARRQKSWRLDFKQTKKPT
jgi:hypothetical protein